MVIIKQRTIFYFMSLRSSSKKGVIRSLKSKDRKYNGQKKKGQKTNNYPQNTTQETED